ncbi:MAG: AzlC family ABC transporter permease [Anderseniella sp.]
MGTRIQEFSAGAIAILPVLVATAPIALLFGTLAAAKGLSAFEVWLMSATVYAGALQFVAIDQWADPAPIGLLLFTALVVNVRHVLMGASIGRAMTDFSRPAKYAAMFVLTDEGWAFAERRVRDGSLTPAYYFGIGVSMWLVWTSGSLLGAIIGSGLGDPSAYGFNFAFSAVFICILVGFWSNWRTGAVLAASGAVSAMVYLLVPGAWYIIAGAFAGVGMAAALHADSDDRKPDGILPS